jgi:hypothetical protein
MSINVALQPMFPVARTPNRSGAIIFDKPVAGTVITDIIALAKKEITQSLLLPSSYNQIVRGIGRYFYLKKLG